LATQQFLVLLLGVRFLSPQLSPTADPHVRESAFVVFDVRPGDRRRTGVPVADPCGIDQHGCYRRSALLGPFV
jgi:hypothetical protein